MSTSSGDLREWLRRWDAQQQLHLPHREDRFAAITEALASAAGPSPRVIDLGCGPGSLSARVLQRLPDAEIVAIDTDPVLLAIGRGALGDQRRIHFVDADLRDGWAESLPLASPFDGAVSTTALHWLDLPDLVRLYRTLAQLLREGAVFLNGDRLDFGHDQNAIARTAENARSDQQPSPAAASDAEDWETFWAAVERDPALAEAAAERRRRGHDHPHGEPPQTYEFHRAALLAAGFSEVGTVWQRLTDRVLIAIR